MQRYSYQYWGLRFLSPESQALCLSNVTKNIVNAGTCSEVALCILDYSTEYAKIGFASGTTLLTLIPTAVSLIPTNGPGVDEAVRIGWMFAFLAAFSGYITAGEGSKRLAEEIRRKRLGVAPSSEGEFLIRGWVRWGLYGLVAFGMGVLIYLSTTLGLETLVSWACNHELLQVGWLFARVFPYIFEYVMLRLLRIWIRRSPDTMQTWNGSDISTAWLLAETIWGLSLALVGLVVLYGTSLLGSTNLIDGSTVIWEYLLLFPILFCSMQMVLRACALRNRTSDDKSLELLAINRADEGFSKLPHDSDQVDGAL